MFFQILAQCAPPHVCLAKEVNKVQVRPQTSQVAQSKIPNKHFQVNTTPGATFFCWIVGQGDDGFEIS